jgi:hypothetical protein
LDWEEQPPIRDGTGKVGKQRPYGECPVAVAVLRADVVDQSAQVVMRASCSEKTHMKRAATLWWVIVLLSSWTMSMLISCQMMSETS